jgi:hypothetical protein
MWMIDPKLMCNQHLVGEHVELHMLYGCMEKGRSIAGYAKNGVVEMAKLSERHDDLVEEMLSRDMRHKSPMDPVKAATMVSYLAPFEREATVDRQASLAELHRRCPACCKRAGVSWT